MWFASCLPFLGRKAGRLFKCSSEQKMKIKTVKLRGFCGFSDFTAELADCSVFIGPNSGGKTTLLRAISFAFDGMALAMKNGRDNLRHGRDELVRHDRDTSEGSENLRQRAKSEAEITSYLRNQASRRTEIEQRMRPLQFACRELIARFGVSDPLSLHFKHDKGFSFGVSLVLNHNDGDEVVLSLRAADEVDVIFIDVDVGGKSLLTTLEPDKIKLLEKLASSPADLVAPIANVLPSELAKSWPEVEKSKNNGREFEVWRNRIHRLSEGRSPDAFKKIVDRIQGPLGGVMVNFPGRTHEQNPRVAITYQEDGMQFKVSESGAGFRTLLSLAATVEHFRTLPFCSLTSQILTFIRRSSDRLPSSFLTQQIRESRSL
jgi:AAA ATPase domain